jgi:hypothetical protein
MRLSHVKSFAIPRGHLVDDRSRRFLNPRGWLLDRPRPAS